MFKPLIAISLVAILSASGGYYFSAYTTETVVATQELEVRNLKDMIKTLTREARLNKKIIAGMSFDLAKAKDQAALHEDRANTGIASYRLKFRSCVQDTKDLTQSLEGMSTELNACKNTVLSLNDDVDAATKKVAEMQGELATQQSRLPAIIAAIQQKFQEARSPTLPAQ